MQILVNVLRWVTHKFAIFVMSLALSIGIPLVAVSNHVTDVDVVKGWLSETNTYETLLEESFNLIERESGTEGETLGEALEGSEFLTEEDLLNALREGISAEFIQGEAERAIDGTYAWLDGTTERPEFEVSLASRQQPVADALGSTLRENLAALPTCTPEQLTPEFDLVTAQCLPEGVELDTEIDRFVEDFAGQDGFLDELSFNSSEIELSDTDARNGQEIYSALQGSLMTMLLIVLVSGTIVILTAKRGIWFGLGDFASTMIGSTFLMFIFAIVSTNVSSITNTFIGQEDGASQTEVEAARRIVEPLTERIISDIGTQVAIMTGVIIVVGIFLWFLGYRRRRDIDEAEKKSADPKPVIPETPAPKTKPATGTAEDAAAEAADALSENSTSTPGKTDKS